MAGRIYFYIGWKTEGRDPDYSSEKFESMADAKKALRDELRWLSDDAAGDEARDLFDAALAVERANVDLSQRYYSWTVGKFEYFIRLVHQDAPSYGVGML